MARYIVSGLVNSKRKFSIEVDAESERHVIHMAMSKIGSSQKQKSTRIKITQVKKVEG